ncbi:MAG: hypothetical protein ACXACI_07405 [Candidatus Hodarchaeales archaeon]|jgi:hypothetical protein
MTQRDTVYWDPGLQHIDPGLRHIGKYISLLGCYLLLFQNCLIIPIALLEGFEEGFPLFKNLLILDLIGFSLLGIGLVIYGISSRKIRPISASGACFLGWVVISLNWRDEKKIWDTVKVYRFAEERVDPPEYVDITYFADELMIFSLLASALFLLVGFHLLLNRRMGDRQLSIYSYTILNCLGAIPFFGIVLKLYIVPVFGVWAFYTLIAILRDEEMLRGIQN